MICEISIQFESMDEARAMEKVLRVNKVKFQGPYYLNKYGVRDVDNPLDVNRAGDYAGMTEDQVEGGTNDD